MRRLIVSASASLDGVIDGQCVAAVETWRPPFSDVEFERLATEQLDGCDALLLGRETYQRFAESWPMADGRGFAGRIHRLPKYVASTTLTEPLAWNASLLRGSVPGAVAELKRAPGGDVLMYGCGRLAASLTRHGLVDRLQVWVHPVVAGPGVRLFHDTASLTAFQLTRVDTLTSGVAVLTYRPGSPDQSDHRGAPGDRGPPRYGGDWGSLAEPRLAGGADGGGTTGPMSPSGAWSRSTITGAWSLGPVPLRA